MSSRRRRSGSPRVRRTLLAGSAVGFAFSTSLLALAPAAAEDSACSAMTAPVYTRSSPKISTTLLTLSGQEATIAGQKYGFTTDEGVSFKASAGAAAGLVPVRRLYNAARNDFAWAATTSDVSALTAAGFVNQKTDFYAVPPTSVEGCATPVLGFVKGGKHRYTADEGIAASLRAAGWKQVGVAFYGGSPTTSLGAQPFVQTATQPIIPDTASAFSIEVIPDSQREMHSDADTRFPNRMDWLVANKDALDLRYVVHTGDVTDWDDSSHSMYQRASAGFATLEGAGIGWVAAVGNHDTAAVCTGGSACPGQKASVALRDTAVWNSYFPPSRLTDVGGTFQAGKSDNVWTTFRGGGKDFLVLTLELWPRQSVIDWANQVLSNHPAHNVIINTHMFLESDGTVSTSDGGYGATSPSYLYENLIARHDNIKLVLSGHTGDGAYASRVQTTPSGNRVVMLNGTWHSADSNPTRQLQIDPTLGQIVTRTYGPKTNQTWPGANQTFSGLTFVG